MHDMNQRMNIRSHRLAAWAVLGLFLIALVDCAPKAVVIPVGAEIPAIEPGMARVWFVRASDSPRGDVQAYAPMVFVNGSPIAAIRTQTGFFRDFAPGAYRFTVEPYGLPTAQAVAVSLAAGKQTYLQVLWTASWETGYPEAGWGFGPNTFNILTMPPQVAEAYLPTLTYSGAR
jgi:hypothetical protein